MRRTKSGVCRSRSEILSIREGLFRPIFRTLSVRKENCSVGIAFRGWGLSIGCAGNFGAAARVTGGGPGLPLGARDPGERFA